MDGLREPSRSLRHIIAARRLTWWPDIGIGYYPVEAGIAPYNTAYFDRFADQANSEIGRTLMRARVDFVARHFSGTLVDVGIGSGAFVELRNQGRRKTYGWDVCPKAMKWLADKNLLIDPNLVPVDAISLWDVLEHIHDFRHLLDNVREWVFVSLPIFNDCDHVLGSKHFRKDEHVWYFTAPGLITVMNSLGFDCIEHSDIETKIGREDIGSFAFRRR